MRTISATELRDICPAAFAEHPAPWTTQRYEYVNTWSLVQPLVDAGWQITHACQRGKDRYAAHIVHLYPASSTVLPVTMQVGEMRAQVRLRNSHDGSTIFDIGCGIFVCTCTNQLVVPVSGIAGMTWRGKHLTGRIHPAELDPLLRQFGTINDTIDRMKGHRPTEPDLVLYYKRCHAAVHDRLDITHVSDSEVQPLLVDPQPDVWSMFNHAQSYYIEGRRPRSRGIREPLRNEQLNRAFWSAAESIINV